MGQIAVHHWYGNGATAYIDLGFTPGKVVLDCDVTGTNPDFVHWSPFIQDASHFGILTTGSSGNRTIITTAATGISALAETAAERVKIPHPQTGLKVPTTVTDWIATTTYNGALRTASVIGTVVRPPIHNHKVFEQISGTGAGTSAPTTWDVNPGETVTDGGSNVWICRMEETVSIGECGVIIGATLNVNDKYFLLTAWEADRSKAFGDCDNYPGGILSLNTRNTT